MTAILADIDTNAITLALLGSVIAGMGWVGLKIFERVERSLTWRADRRAALIMFFNELRMRLENTRSTFSTEVRDRLLDALDTAPEGFRFYGLDTINTGELEALRPFIPSLSPTETWLIYSYSEYLLLFAGYYRKIQSEDFAKLEVGRKKQVVMQLFSQASDVARLSEELIDTLKKRHGNLAEMDREIASLIKRIEDDRIRSEGEAGQS